MSCAYTLLVLLLKGYPLIVGRVVKVLGIDFYLRGRIRSFFVFEELQEHIGLEKSLLSLSMDLITRCVYISRQ